MADRLTKERNAGFFLARWHPFAWIAGVVLLLYFRTLFFDFTNWDDYHLIVRNAAFLKDLSNLPHLFGQHILAVDSPQGSYYRPLVMVSFMIDAQVAGAAPWVYHLDNMLLHAVAACLVFVLFRTLTSGCASGAVTAFLMALLYAVHPLSVSATAWIPGRNDLLLAVFSLASVIAYVNYLRSRGRLPYLAHLVFLTLGLFAKEPALAVVVVCAAYSMLRADRRASAAGTTPLPVRARIRDGIKSCLWMEWLGIALFWFVIRLSVIRCVATQASSAGVLKSVILNAAGFIELYGKTMLPFNLSVLPTQQDTSVVYGLLALLIAALALTLPARGRRWDLVAMGVLWFAAFLIPAFIVPASDPSRDLRLLEHRLYLPLAGAMLIWIGSGLPAARWMRGRTGLLAWACVFLAFAGQTLAYTRSFRDPLTFWRSAVRSAPHSPVAHKNFGAILSMNGHPTEAEASYRRALQLNPAELFVHGNLGMMYLERGLPERAEAEFKKEIGMSPGHPKAYQDLAGLLEKQGRRDEADEWLRKMRERVFGKKPDARPL